MFRTDQEFLFEHLHVYHLLSVVFLLKFNLNKVKFST